MKEYEKTISRLLAEKSEEKLAFEEKHVDLIKERDQAQQHLNNMEIAFADIHQFVPMQYYLCFTYSIYWQFKTR